jgi:hypothetical protein
MLSGWLWEKRTSDCLLESWLGKYSGLLEVTSNLDRKVRKIFVSGCLGGAKIRFNATGVNMDEAIWQKWQEEQRLFYFCPEIAAGFAIPRPAPEALIPWATPPILRQINGLTTGGQ